MTLRIVRTGTLVHHESSQGAFCFKVTQRLTPPSNSSWLFSYPTTVRQSTTTDWVATRFACNRRLSQLRYNTSEPQVKAFRLPENLTRPCLGRLSRTSKHKHTAAGMSREFVLGRDLYIQKHIVFALPGSQGITSRFLDECTV